MAGRPRKPEAEKMEDFFFDLTASEQEHVLDRLALLHRLKKRQAPSVASRDKQSSLSSEFMGKLGEEGAA